MAIIIPEPDKPRPKAPDIDPAVAQILMKGGQIMLPFNCGDAQIIFHSRWELGKLIQAAIDEAIERTRDLVDEANYPKSLVEGR